MDYSQIFAISAAGMTAERSRVEVAALNLANAHTVQQPGAAGYQPLRTVVRAGAFASIVGDGLAAAPLPVVSVEAMQAGPRAVHEPGHPLADEGGFVSYPAIDPATEMVTLMSAMRSYEANVAAMNTARVLALKTLDIGRAS
jgi:flagellar basal-body rod protein FlgC